MKPERVLEIGTYRAGTLLLWSQLASRRVVSCDLEVTPHMRELYESFPPEHSDCRVTVLEGDTHDEAFRDRALEAAGSPVDFLFIDGDHSTEGVRRDYELYKHCVRPGA